VREAKWGSGQRVALNHSHFFGKELHASADGGNTKLRPPDPVHKAFGAAHDTLVECIGVSRRARSVSARVLCGSPLPPSGNAHLPLQGRQVSLLLLMVWFTPKGSRVFFAGATSQMSRPRLPV